MPNVSTPTPILDQVRIQWHAILQNSDMMDYLLMRLQPIGFAQIRDI